MRSTDLVLMGVINAILLIILIFAAYRTRRRWRIRRDLRAFRASAGHATGRIVDNLLESRRGRVGDLLFWPVVTFTGPAGDDVTFTARRPYRRQFLVGGVIEVSYNPADPHDAEITGETPEPRLLRIKIALVVILAVVLCWSVVVHLLALTGVIQDV